MTEGDRAEVTLTPLRDEDSAALLAWINDRDLVIRNAAFRPVDRGEHDAWFAAIRERADVRICAIRRVTDDRLIGSCQLRGLDSPHSDAELQIRIGERDAWGQGHGTQAVRLLVEQGFGPHGLHRIHLHVFADNAPALAVYNKVGFREEGRLREAALIEGDRRDLIVMGLLAQEYADGA